MPKLSLNSLKWKLCTPHQRSLASHRCCFWPHLLTSPRTGRIAINTKLYWEVQGRHADLPGLVCRNWSQGAAQGLGHLCSLAMIKQEIQWWNKMVPLCLQDTEITGPKKKKKKEGKQQIRLCVRSNISVFFFSFSWCWVENPKCPIFVNNIKKLIKI